MAAAHRQATPEAARQARADHTAAALQATITEAVHTLETTPTAGAVLLQEVHIAEAAHTQAAVRDTAAEVHHPEEVTAEEEVHHPEATEDKVTSRKSA